MDLDHFKRFNDIYGHNTGDSVLCMVARTMSHALRAIDIIGRWGGEEFIASLPDIRQKTALRMTAEKIGTLVECSRLDVTQQHLTVTLSVGRTLLLQGDTHDSLVGRADELIYCSNQAGRNCVWIG